MALLSVAQGLEQTYDPNSKPNKVFGDNQSPIEVYDFEGGAEHCLRQYCRNIPGDGRCNDQWHGGNHAENADVGAAPEEKMDCD